MMLVLLQNGMMTMKPMMMMRKQHIYSYPNVDMGMVGSCLPARIRRRRRRRKGGYSFSCLSTLCSPSLSNIPLLDIIHNKVLIAAAASAAIGQLSKPFTSRILYGRGNLDFRNAIRPGGFPSTHSSAAVATATTLGLERGFSDSIFGLAVVYACLIMYDAQGVRREVGSHAKVINKALLRSKVVDQEDCHMDGNHKESSYELSSNLETTTRVAVGNAASLLQPKTEANKTQDDGPLKETVGHTEIEVIAGAALGFFVSLAVSSSSSFCN